MMLVRNLPMFLPVGLYLFVMGLLLLWLGRKNSRARSARAGCGVSRAVEAVVLLCGMLLAGFYAADVTHRNEAILLHLGDLRPAYAATHLVLLASVGVVLLAALILCIFGRTSAAVLLSVSVLMAYGALIKECRNNRVPYLMTLIAPEGSWEPVITYTFQFQDEPERQGDLWINDAYLGKMPLTISGRELYAKTPEFDQKAKEQYRQKALGSVREICQINLFTVKTHRANGQYFYTGGIQECFAKVQIGETLHRAFGYGMCQSKAAGRRYEYVVTIPPSLEEFQKTSERRGGGVATLLQKARLSGYRVDAEWKAALMSYGDDGWRAMRNAAVREEGFKELIDEWVREEYGIGRESAERIFERICSEADAEMVYRTGLVEGAAVEMIYGELDPASLARRYVKAIKSKKSFCSSRSTSEIGGQTHYGYDHRPSEGHPEGLLPASVSVVRHALELWDRRLDEEDDGADNVIEKEVTPAILIYWYDVELAGVFGGSVYEEHLLRQYRRERRLEGVELAHQDRVYKQGMDLNRWLYYLVELDSPGGRAFRTEHSSVVKEMIDLLVTGMHNHYRTPPQFLFHDLELGRRSLAYRYWKDYLIAVEGSFPGWEYEKLEKRFAYLAKLGDLADEEMYKESWDRVNDEEFNMMNRLADLLETVPAARREFVSRYVFEDIQKRDVRNKEVIVRQLKFALARHGDEALLREFQDAAGSVEYQDEVRRFVGCDFAFNNPFVRVLAEHANPEVRKAVVALCTRYPTPEYVEMLGELLDDPDGWVRAAAEKASAELDRIRSLPISDLTASSGANRQV